MKVTELIARALFLAGIDGRDLDQATSGQGKDGLFFLNMLLAEKSITTQYIPYISHTTFNSVVGQELYVIPNLVDLEVLSFEWQTVRYYLTPQPRKPYFAPPRANNVKSLPLYYYAERSNEGMRIYLYFLPDNNQYEFQITGKYALSQVGYDDDLSLTLELWYQSYLMYELAKRICDFYNITLPPQAAMQLEEFKSQIRNINPMDLTITSISTLNNGSFLNYGQVNIGKGWTTP